MSFQLEALEVRCDGGLEGPEGRLLEVFAQNSMKSEEKKKWLLLQLQRAPDEAFAHNLINPKNN